MFKIYLLAYAALQLFETLFVGIIFFNLYFEKY